MQPRGRLLDFELRVNRYNLLRNLRYEADA